MKKTEYYLFKWSPVYGPKWSPKINFAKIFLLFVFFNIQAYSYGQDVKIDLNVNDSPIENVLEQIEQLTNYKMLYSPDDVDLNRRVSINAENKTLKKILSEIFEGTTTTYLVLDEQIILKKAVGAKLPNKTNAKIQKTVDGVVSDVIGSPIVGVNVLVQGEQRGAVTDFDGGFSIKVAAGDVLLFTFLGFKDQEITVGKQAFYEVVLEEQAFQLEGVELVSDGYQSISKERVTGAFDKVNDKILKPKIVQDVFAKIEGEVPGLLINGPTDQTGTFGNEVTIRGRNTINGERKPLVVLDGFPLEGTPRDINIATNTINPNDIESITVLKDAAASSIWGVRAANGVIVIKTKKGRKNQRITADIAVSTAITSERDLTQSRFANATDQIDFVRELFDRNGNQILGTEALFDGQLNNQSLNLLNPAVAVVLQERRGDITAAEAAQRFAALEERNLARDVQNYIRPQVWNQYNLGLSGGGDNYTFNSSVLINLNENELPGADSRQFIANIRNTYDITDDLELRTSLNYTQRKSRNSFIGADPFFLFGSESLLNRTVDQNGNRVPMQNAGFFSALSGANQESSDLAVQRGFPALTFNILDELDNADNTDRNNDIRLQAALSYNITDQLAASISYQYEEQNNTNRIFSNENTFLTRSTIAQFAQIDPQSQQAVEFPVPRGGFLDIVTSNSRSFTARAQLNYDTQFKEGLHKVNALAGYEVRETIQRVNRNNRVFGFSEETLTSVPVDLISLFPNPFSLFGETGRIQDPGGFNKFSFIENRFISTYANLAYTYKDTYTASGSIRLDDTNLFGASDEFRNIPLFSLGFRWNLKQGFFSDTDFLGSLNFRATYGENGNVARGTSPLLFATLNQEFDVFDHTSAFVSNPPNPLLRLERTASLNLGIDFNVFDRVYGTFEYYDNVSDDLLASSNVNSTLGVRNLVQNVGELTNTGVNLSLGVTAINTNTLRFDTRGTFTFNSNRITRSDVDFRDILTYTLGGANLEGEDINTIYSFRYGGLDSEGRPQYINQENELDDYATNQADVDDLERSGTTVPPYFGSWINELNYKDFSLRILTTFKAGHIFRATAENGLIFDPANTSLDTFNAGNDVGQRWRLPGDENLTRIPRVGTINEIFSNNYAFYSLANEHIARADHIRLSQITLDYSLPQEILDKIGVRSLSFGLQADNVMVWNFNQFDVDPENIIPRPPTFSLRISTTL